MQKFCLLLLLCLLCVTLVSCAPRQPLSTEPEQAPVLSPDQQLAQFLGESAPGSSSAFANTSLGNSVTVTTQGAYVSGLGEFCREGVAATNQGKTRIAACQDRKTEAWRLAPAIFGHGAL